MVWHNAEKKAKNIDGTTVSEIRTDGVGTCNMVMDSDSASLKVNKETKRLYTVVSLDNKMAKFICKNNGMFRIDISRGNWNRDFT